MIKFFKNLVSKFKKKPTSENLSLGDELLVNGNFDFGHTGWNGNAYISFLKGDIQLNQKGLPSFVFQKKKIKANKGDKFYVELDIEKVKSKGDLRLSFNNESFVDIKDISKKIKICEIVTITEKTSKGQFKISTTNENSLECTIKNCSVKKII